MNEHIVIAAIALVSFAVGYLTAAWLGRRN
jgi:hypothetical protein